ncbi:hypothetical protein MSG28_000608 [Choristoneura fumiferana]|uniref:Uncharacterized protein n=1 Tax=Choristoneura fumiferana TaxID=7141 RepID=A0ACC0K1G9_CHOFU|nr:hypothetical protein MSG28_000608 [Choristoneura fumiferana]
MIAKSSNADIHIEGPKLIIDHDGGADDAMAIFMALIYEQYFNGRIDGLVPPRHYITTAPSTSIQQPLQVPIYRGSNFSLVISVPSDFYFGHDGLGDNDHEEIKPIDAQPQHAALSFIELTNKYPGEITIVALGALTNIALAIRLDSTFISRLSHMYVAAGHVYSDRRGINTNEFTIKEDANARLVNGVFKEEYQNLLFSIFSAELC